MSNAKDHPVIPIRAKAGYIEEKRKDKSGRTVPAKQHMVVSEGMHTAKEMEQIMVGIAKEVGADESQIRIDTYKQGRAPIEANPRHRTTIPRWERYVGEVKPREFLRQRHLWAGGIPQTPDEWRLYIDAFNMRKEQNDH